MRMYGRFFLEFIDLFKDIFYCAIVAHEDANLTYFLWIFALFAHLFLIFKILIMRKVTYKDTYGDEEFAVEEKKMKGKKSVSFWGLKFKRVFREVFYLPKEKDRDDIEVKVRQARQMMFVAMFKNFPMFFMQLWESFELGYTFGLWKGFSVFFSVWLF